MCWPHITNIMNWTFNNTALLRLFWSSVEVDDIQLMIQRFIFKITKKKTVIIRRTWPDNKSWFNKMNYIALHIVDN